MNSVDTFIMSPLLAEIQISFNFGFSYNLKLLFMPIPVTIIGGLNTLYFNESSSKQTTFSWYLCVPVDNAPDTYTTTMQYDTYDYYRGWITSIQEPRGVAGLGFDYLYTCDQLGRPDTVSSDTELIHQLPEQSPKVHRPCRNELRVCHIARWNNPT